MSLVKRFDRGELRRPVRLDNGYLRVDAYLTRAGVFEYRRADGTVLREYRPPDEVFAADSMESFDLLPVTNDHPPVGLLTPENTHQFQVGLAGGIAREDSRMRGAMKITDAKAIKDLERGKVQVSLGYVCQLDFTAGVTPEGERYDAVQRNIRGNHVAIVGAGRAGPEIRVRMDTVDAAMVVCSSEHSDPPGAAETTVKRQIKLDNGQTIEVEDTVAALFEQGQAKADAAIKTAETKAAEATARADKEAARADTAEAEAKRLAAELAAAPAKILAEAKAQAELHGKARGVLGAAANFDGKSEREVKAAVLAKLAPDLKLDGKSDDYVSARFDAELERQSQKNDGLAQARAAVAASGARTDSTDDSVAKAKAEYLKTVSK
jgi:hypothetical protein